MARLRWWKLAFLAGLGSAVMASTGCQTWVGGMTLPSGRYLDHPPQYFPQDPMFPLEREMATMEAYDSLAPGVIPGDLPPVLPGGPAPGGAAVPAPGMLP